MDNIGFFPTVSSKTDNLSVPTTFQIDSQLIIFLLVIAVIILGFALAYSRLAPTLHA